jgi:hypothetical protein
MAEWQRTAPQWVILHDQITARVCVEYFTVFHPPVFNTQSPTLLACGWGVIATWWVGLFLGLFLAVAARIGPRPKLSVRKDEDEDEDKQENPQWVVEAWDYLLRK